MNNGLFSTKGQRTRSLVSHLNIIFVYVRRCYTPVFHDWNFSIPPPLSPPPPLCRFIVHLFIASVVYFAATPFCGASCGTRRWFSLTWRANKHHVTGRLATFTWRNVPAKFVSIFRSCNGKMNERANAVKLPKKLPRCGWSSDLPTPWKKD